MSSSMPWVKIYTEMIDDPKIGRLNDATKWRFVSLVLLAGECDQDGALISGNESMSVTDIAWRLRVTREQCETEIKPLVDCGILAEDDGLYFIPKFSDRQGRPQSEKRAMWRERQSRLREQKETPESVTRDSPVTHASRVDKSREEKRRVEKSREENAADAALPRAVQTYIDAGGKFNPGTLADGTTKKANAYRVITETVTDDDDSIAFWRRVVEAYCAQWSSKSYTIMLSEYYSQGRVPGQPKSNNGNGNGQHAPQSNALAALERMKERHNGDK